MTNRVNRNWSTIVSGRLNQFDGVEPQSVSLDVESVAATPAPVEQGPGTVIVADGTATRIVGATGATGAVGPTGPAGSPGGATGLQGNVGPMGATGLQGNVGPMGATGLQGNVGPMGATGLQGNVGPAGPAGTIANIAVYDEGNLVASSISSINFVGAIVTANTLGADVTVTIAGNNTPLSVDKLVSGNAQVILNTSGPEPYVLFPAASTGGQLQMSEAELSSIAGNLALTSVQDAFVISNGDGSVPGGSKLWKFDRTGNLTLPQTAMDVSPAPVSWPGITFSDGTFQNTAYTGGGGGGAAGTVDITNTNGLTTTYYPTFVESRTSGQYMRADVDLTYRTDDNLLRAGNIQVGRNIYGSAFYGISNAIQLRPNIDIDKRFLFTVDSGGGNYIRSGMEMPLAEVDKAVSLGFPHLNGNSGYIYIQGTDTNGTEFNDAFNIMMNSGNVKISALSYAGGNKVWQFDTSGNLTLPQTNMNASPAPVSLPGVTWTDGTFQTGGTIKVPQWQSFRIETNIPPGGAGNVEINQTRIKTSSLGFLVEVGNGNYYYFNGLVKRFSHSESNGYIAFGTETRDQTGHFNDIEIKSYGDGTNGNVYITAGTNPTSTRWAFQQSGTIRFPDASQQSTAWTGSAAAVQSTPPASPVTGQMYYDTDDGRTYIYTGAAWIDANPAGGGGSAALDEAFGNLTAATGVVTHDCTTNRLFYHTSMSANFTANFTNLNLSAGRSTSISLVLVQGGTARMVTAVQIGGVAQTITWQGSASAPAGNANRTDAVTFSILNVGGTYTVLGMMTSFGGV